MTVRLIGSHTHVVYVGRDVVALHYFSDEPPRDNAIVVTFDYFREGVRLEPRPYWRRSLRELGYHQVHVFCSWDHWFQTPELDVLANLIPSLFHGRRIVAVGGSMGGFGALRFAARCQVDRLVVISPQCFIDPSRDQRYANEWKPLQPEVCPNPHCHSIALYDPHNSIDKVHVDQLSRTQPDKTISIPMHFYGHWIDYAVDQKGDLTHLVQCLLTMEFSTSDVRALARKDRLGSSHYAENSAAYMKRKKMKWAA